MADDKRGRGRRARKKSAHTKQTSKTTKGTARQRTKPPRSKPESARAAKSPETPAVADVRAVLDLLNRATAGAAAAPQPDRRPAERPLDDACQRLLDLVRQHCPEILPAVPLEAGKTAAPIPVRAKDAGTLITLAARQAALEAAGVSVPPDPDRLPTSVLWQEGPDALLVQVGSITVSIGDGVITVAIPVRCDQLRRGFGVVHVDLVVGTLERPAGLLAAATEPRGPRTIVARWGDALTALAWQAVLDSLGGVAAAAGVDRDGTNLIPVALTASTSGFGVLAQARHAMDRVRPGRVVSSPLRTGVQRP